MGLFKQKLPVTSITTSIDLATMSSRSHTDDVTLVIDICNLINSTELGAKEARKVIQRKLSSGDSVVQLLSVKLLQQLADNGGPRFHAQLCAKTFIETLHTLATNPIDSQVKQHILAFLRSCDSQFADNPSLSAIVTLSRSVHDSTFVLESGSNWSRIISGITSGSAKDEEDAGRGTIRRVPRRRMTSSSSGTTTESKKHMSEDLVQVKNSVQILLQTLSFTDPEKEDITKNELIQEFYITCKEQQELLAKRLTEAAESPETEDLENLLVVNDELQFAFQIYNQMLERANAKRATRTNTPELYSKTPSQVQATSSSASWDQSLNDGAVSSGLVIPKQTRQTEEIPAEWVQRSTVFMAQEPRSYAGEHSNAMTVPTSTNPFHQRIISPPESPSFAYKGLPNNGYSPPDSRPSSRPASPFSSAPYGRPASPFSSAPYGITPPAHNASTNPFYQRSPSLIPTEFDLVPPPTIPTALTLPPAPLNPNNPFVSKRSSLQTNPFQGAWH